MKYIAITDGFIGGRRVRKGESFEHEGKPGKWMEAAKEVKAEQPAKQDKKRDKAEPQGSASNQDVI